MASDLISRSALIKKMNERYRDIHNVYPNTLSEGFRAVHHIALDLPTVDAVEVKEARWKGEGFGDYSCSLCGEIVTGNSYNYCPDCGAKMDGDKE